MHTAKGPTQGWKKSVANYAGDAGQKTNGYDGDSEDTLQAWNFEPGWTILQAEIVVMY